MTQEEIITSLQSSLSEAAAARLAKRIVPITRLTTQDARRVPHTVGTSRFGGKPDLPPGFAWPMREGRPLQLLVQLNLAEVRAAIGDTKLPPDGMLYFFYDAGDEPWGFDPKDVDGKRVVYLPAAVAKELVPTAPPAPERGVAKSLHSDTPATYYP